MPAHRTASVVSCLVCGSRFQVIPSQLLRGGGKYCSRLCRDVASTTSLKVRFLRYAGQTTPNGCRPWLGATIKAGYGVLSVGFGPGTTRTLVYAHRLAWQFANGTVPQGLSVLHHCDNPACIAVGHLFLGTDADNSDDKISKNRHAKGTDFPIAKLTDDGVRQIRHLYSTGRYSQTKLASMFGVSGANVCLIVNRKAWKHVPD
jgi:hypothetical protein